MTPVSPIRPGARLSLRRVREDGEQGDLVGFVLEADARHLVLRDRRGVVHDVPWPAVLAWRTVDVARGRDPQRTPLAVLDTLAAAAGVTGRVFVARICDVLVGVPPVPLEEWDAPPPSPARLDGEWVTAGPSADYVALAWWGAHRDARSLQVRAADPATVADLLRLNFRSHPSSPL